VSPSKSRSSTRPTARSALQARLVCAFAVVLVVGLLLVTLVTSRDATWRMGKYVQDETAAVAEAVAVSVGGYLKAGDIAAMQRMVDRLEDHEHIRFIAFYSPSWQELTRSSIDEVAPGYRARLLSMPVSRVEEFEHHQIGPHTAMLMPVIAGDGEGSRLRGFAVVGLSLEAIQRHQAVTARTTMSVAGGVGIWALATYSFLVRRWLLPLRQMSDATRRIINGEVDNRVDEKHDRLLAGLPRAFNEMLQWLARYRGEIQDANDRLEQANRRLETTVTRRTSQLETANDRLRAEIAEKEDFLRAVSHDLNAPLRNIGGMVTLVLSKHRAALPEDVVQKLDRITKNVEAESSLINELLELSRIKTRRQRFESVDLEAMIWELRGVFENDLKTRNIDLILESSMPRLWAEKARIRQVFQNLIDNAIKYMGEGSLRQIRVSASVRMDEVEFSVTDTGSGIHPNDLERVFHVFRRGRSEIAQKVPGKGVGLSSVKSIIETYDGRIWVESELGRGTAFRFTINGAFLPDASGVARASTMKFDNREDEAQAA
jgi:signal transduction histidine kinase